MFMLETQSNYNPSNLEHNKWMILLILPQYPIQNFKLNRRIDWLVIIFFIHCYLETLQNLGHIASRVFGCVPEGCAFPLLCSQCLNCQVHWYNFMIYEFDNGQMGRGNENTTQHLPWWLRKPRKNLSQVGRHRDLNPGPPECESRALPRSHLAR